jgi:zinc transporter 1/2/3
MILSLVIHSIFEGIAIGSLNDNQTIIQLSLAVLIHKSIISFSVGVKLISAATNKGSAYLACIILASATPIGILIMLSMQEFFPSNSSTKIINDILRAFACGTFFYITFFDVLPHELNASSKIRPLIKTFCVFIGFTVTAVLLIATK